MEHKFFEAAMKMLIARIPDENIKQLADLIGSALELKAQLDRIEVRQAGIELSLQTLVKLLVTPEMMREIEYEREDRGFVGTSDE